MSYLAIYTASNDADFQGRCLVAAWIAAQNIMSEDPQTANHTQRIDWAASVLRNSTRITPRQLAMQVLKNATIASAPSSASDGDIQFQINSVVADLIAIG